MIPGGRYSVICTERRKSPAPTWIAPTRVTHTQPTGPSAGDVLDRLRDKHNLARQAA